MKRENLDLGHMLLYAPYKNILTKFVELSINPKAIEFDPISKIFDGLESISEGLKHYYEALLGVTSYYQHSQGGRGKYIEKKFASLVNSCSLNIKLSELPFWLQYPDLHRKKGIFTLKNLSSNEKSIIRRIDWDYIGKEDETTDLGNLLKKEKTIVLIELKNRVDSGGTAARREIWTKKFKTILNYIYDNTIKLYRREDKEFSLTELLKIFGFEKIEIYIAILFNADGNSATRLGDKENGFYSSNEEGYRDLKNAILNKGLTILTDNISELEISFKINGIYVLFGAIYGDEIPLKYFRQNYSISDILILNYDDIWLSQLTAISERKFLLEFNNNYMKIFKNIVKKDQKIRILYDKFITSEGDENTLQKLIEYLIQNFSKDFPSNLCPSQKNRIEYLADVIQIIAASEA